MNIYSFGIVKRWNRYILPAGVLIFIIYIVFIAFPNLMTSKVSLALSLLFVLLAVNNPLVFSYFFIIYLMTFKTLSYLFYVPTFIDYTVVVTPFLLFIYQIISHKNNEWHKSIFIIYLFLFYIILNGLLLDKGAMVIIREILFIGNVFFIFFYYYFEKKFTIEHYISIVRLIISLVLIQFVFQFLELYGIPRTLPNHPDSYSGTLGFTGTGILGNFCLVGSIYFLIRIINKREKLSIGLIAIGILTIQAFIGESKFYMYGFISSLIFIIVLLMSGYLKIKMKKLILFSFTTVFALILMINLYQIAINRYSFSISLNTLFDKRFIENIAFKEQYYAGSRLYISRGAGLLLAYQTIGTDFYTSLLGKGIGTGKTNESRTFGAKNETTNNQLADVFYGLDLFLIELGFIGLIIFIIILYLLYRTFKRVSYCNNHPVIGKYLDFYISFLFVYILSFQYSGGWLNIQAFNAFFWILSAGLFVIYKASNINQINQY